jgi:DivIVA domain-containing protein
MTDDRPSTSEAGGAQSSGTASEQEPRFSELRRYVPPDLLNVSFPASVRGYDRAAVDAHLQRVNQVIAKLKVSASPRTAVTHALEQTEQQVSGLLQRARETGEEITASARQEADQIVADAKGEAADLLVNVSSEADKRKADAEQVVTSTRADAEDILARSRLQAERTLAEARVKVEEEQRQLEETLAALREEQAARMRELQADTEAVRQERRQLLEDIRGRASGLLELADAASAREPAEREGPAPEPESVDEIERAGVATGEGTDDAGGGVPQKRRRAPSQASSKTK